MDAQQIIDILEEAVEIPSLPKAVVKLIAVLGDEDHSRDDVVAVLQTDMGLVTDALRAANTGYAGRGGGDVVTAGQALGRLGEEWLVRTVMARAMRVVRGTELEGYDMGPLTLWEHSIRVAVAAEMLAPRVRVNPAVAYTAGILVDIGKVVTSRFLARLGARLAASLEAHEEATFDHIERLLMGVDHAELGARIAEAWGLPDSLVAAIRFHHRPEEADAHAALCQVVHAADTVASLSGRGLGIDGLLYRVTSDPLPQLVLDRPDVDRLLTAVEARVAEIEALLEL